MDGKVITWQAVKPLIALFHSLFANKKVTEQLALPAEPR